MLYTPLNFRKLHKTITIPRKTITVTTMTTKMKKALVFRVLLDIKKTETPMFQGISVVLPKLYLGGRSDRSRTDNRIIQKQKATVFRLLLMKFQFDKSELVVVNKAGVIPE